MANFFDSRQISNSKLSSLIKESALLRRFTLTPYNSISSGQETGCFYTYFEN